MSSTLSSSEIESVVITNFVDSPCFSIDQQTGNLDQLSLLHQHQGVVGTQSVVHTISVRVFNGCGSPMVDER